MSCEFRQGYLHGSSVRGESITELTQGEYDFVLLSSSWDQRCICVTGSSGIQATFCTIFFPQHRDKLGLRDKHDHTLIEFSNRISSAKEIHGDSGKIEIVWNQLLLNVHHAYSQLRRPMRVLIDLSTCPRYLSLGLLSVLIKEGMASSVTLTYAEGLYPEEQSEEDQHELFTSGAWDLVSVPGLEGDWDPNYKRSYLVSVGFEGTKTLRLISRKEPDEVSLLFPDPGVKVEYVQRAWDRNSPIIDRFKIPDHHIVRAHASDAIQGWKLLAEADIEEPSAQNVHYICCGTKPQSLALALRAIVLKYPSLLYIIPDSHRVVNVIPNGVFWRFDIRDMSSLIQVD